MNSNNPTPAIKWRYPKYDGVPNSGTRVFILTVGRVPILGEWTTDYKSRGYLAWFPSPTRDLDKED